MITPKDDWALQFARCHGTVHGQRFPCVRCHRRRGFGLDSQQRAGLHRLFNPAEIIVDLLLDVFGCILLIRRGHRLHRHLFFQIFRLAAGANPPVRSKSVIETKWTHDIFNIGWVSERPSSLVTSAPTGGFE